MFDWNSTKKVIAISCKPSQLTVDKTVHPQRFDLDPSSQTLPTVWKQWLHKISIFAAKCSTLDAEKLDVLINYVTTTIHEYIAEWKKLRKCTAYFRKNVHEPKNEVFVRHLLPCCRQRNHTDQFIQTMKLLAKYHGLRFLTAEKNQNHPIRDVLTNGMQSNSIRQRFRENRSLDLETAHERPCYLEVAFHECGSFYLPEPTHSISIP